MRNVAKHTIDSFFLFGFFLFKSQLWTVSKCRHLSRCLKIYAMNGRSATSLIPISLSFSLPLSHSLCLLLFLCLSHSVYKCAAHFYELPIYWSFFRFFYDLWALGENGLIVCQEHVLVLVLCVCVSLGVHGCMCVLVLLCVWQGTMAFFDCRRHIKS